MKYKVLVVDDEKLIVKGLRFSLEQDDMEVECAYDGEEALEMAKNKKYDLILLDIQMTPKNGIDTLRDIRSMRDRSDIPVIMLTGVEDKESVLASFKLGICDYILKPFSSDDLLKRIRMVFEPENQSDMES